MRTLPNNSVTSLSEVAGRDVTVAELRPALERRLQEVFDIEFTRPPQARDPFTVIGAMVAGPVSLR